MAHTREHVGDQTLIKDEDGNTVHIIDRVFQNGVMEIHRDGEKIRELTAEQVQTQIDNMNNRVTQLQDRIPEIQATVTRLQDWKNRI